MVIDYKKSKPETIEIYKDTLLESTQYPHGDTVKYDSKLFWDFDIKTERNKTGNIEIINTDTVSALQNYNEGYTCVLNMASYKRPGGGVSWGATAQEECLFRCSNLGLCVSVEHYPLLQTEALYTKNARFIKDFHYRKIEPIVCDVLTIAAINLNKETPEMEIYKDLTSTKIKLMLNLAATHKIDNLILGAWGSGVFKNDPNFISGLFKQHLEENDVLKCFENVIFAIINDRNSVANNYEIYKKTFS